MSRRIVEINGLFFEWPVGQTRPATFAITPEHLQGYLQRTGEARVANVAESQAALDANRAGPYNRKLSAEELVRCFRDANAYERLFIAEGVELVPEARS